MNTKSAYTEAFKKKKDTFEKRKADYDLKISSLKETDKEYADTLINLAKIGAALSVAAITNDEEKLNKLKASSAKESIIKAEIEKRAGIKPFLYECPLCNDTGYVGGAICSCVKKIAGEIMLNSVSLPVKNCRFDNFNLDYYEESSEKGAKPKKRMTEILDFVKAYAYEFSPSSSESLIFYGPTGVGKTHLSLAIMYELVNKGFDVTYGSAFNLFSKIETEHFKYNTDDTYEEAINSDLLIIDDLGSEFTSPYSVAVLYNLLNTRILASKPTIINTNLTITDIQNKYTPRISSRIIGEYTAKVFEGSDIRQKKKPTK